jgi:alkanesulfonate monooxygenase SsuD/methylene tetrahydromethanopterin reductase-like flavin-dependent oxidoreductase (luciferase family)
VAVYRAELECLGRPYRPEQIAVARALQIIRTEEERQTAYALRTKVLKAIGALARGPGAERYQNIGSHADPNLAGEESALLGTPDEIIARLKKLEAGGVDYVLLVDPTGSKTALRAFAEEVMPAFRGNAARAAEHDPGREVPS